MFECKFGENITSGLAPLQSPPHPFLAGSCHCMSGKREGGKGNKKESPPFPSFLLCPPEFLSPPPLLALLSQPTRPENCSAMKPMSIVSLGGIVVLLERKGGGDRGSLAG